MWCNNRKYFAIGCLLSSNDNSSSAFFHSDCNRSHKRRNAAPAPVTKLRIQTTFGEKERAQTQTAFRRFFSLYARARALGASFFQSHWLFEPHSSHHFRRNGIKGNRLSVREMPVDSRSLKMPAIS